MQLSELERYSESPIERLLAQAVASAFGNLEEASMVLVPLRPQEYSYSAVLPEGVAFVIPQASVFANPTRPFRVDLLFVCGRHWRSRRAFAVECDGHEWHEKTKEQAARDKRRDRDMLQIEIATVRFAGSEIFADAAGCADYLRSLIHAATGTALERELGRP